MGYSIIISSADEQLRRQLADTPLEAVNDLIAVLGRDSYPGSSRQEFTRGAWQRVGSLHSSTVASICLHSSHATVDENATGEQGGAHLVDVLDPHDMHQVTRDVGRRPSSHLPELMALQAGGDPYAVAYGPDLTGQTTRSLWCVRADSLPWALDGRAGRELAVAVGRALVCRQDSEITVRNHGAALSRAGGVLGAHADDYARLYWSGNRVASWSRLTQAERDCLLALS